VDDLLGEELLLIERQDHFVGQDVIDEVGAHGGRKAEISDRDRSRPVGEYLRAAVQGVAGKIDDDIGAQIMQERRNVEVARGAHVMKAVECPDQPSPRGAAVVPPQGYADHLEARAVVAFDELRHQRRDRMLTDVGRHIGEPDAVIAPGFAAPERRKRNRDPVADAAARAGELQLRIVAVEQHVVRHDDRCVLGGVPPHLLDKPVMQSKIADRDRT
jgi:hypothetical protein